MKQSSIDELPKLNSDNIRNVSLVSALANGTIVSASSDSEILFNCALISSIEWLLNKSVKDSIISFNVIPPDSTNNYNLFVNLRNTNEYKYY